jgi:hypothetical protein
MLDWYTEVKNALQNQLGSSSSEFISDLTPHTTTTVFFAIQMLEDTIIADYTTEVGKEITGNNLVGVLLSEGTMLYGRFKSITLSKGKAFAYKGV